MERLDYKRLGDYIEQVDVRNTDDVFGEEDVRGISTNKCFMPTKGNLIGVTFTNYKVVSAGQFAFNINTARMGDRFAIALREGTPCIVSSIYVVFQTKEGLLPDYLYLWCSRPEFDRYVRFMSHGSAREIFEWDDMCEVSLPIPSIEEQQKIVADYRAIRQSVETNKEIIGKLEEVTLSIYRNLFINGVDKERLPVGWKKGQLRDVADFFYGKMPDPQKVVDRGYPVYSGYTITKYYPEYTIEEPTIVVIARGDAGSGEIRMSPSKCYLSNLAIGTKLHKQIHKFYLYYYLKNEDTSVLRTGSAQAQVTINTLEGFDVIIPPDDLCSKFEDYITPIYTYKTVLEGQNERLEEMMNNLRL